MIKLIVLIIITFIVIIVFIVTFISAILKRTKRLFVISFLFLILMFNTGIYTLYFGLIKGKEKTEKIAKKAFEKIFPTFDSDKPDTETNKKNFRAFLKVKITPDVKNVYCFDDAIGQDADYMFSFNCDSITAKK